ncbi:hypothetical protein EG329_001162 [Mollisiaceae sp. DMI_Dod_QoI]|nr:hypothetical protein EG329_001162 [Helotiales sp. DMI_Dod_QoI]
MEFDFNGPVLKVLLLIGAQSSHMNPRTELLPFPDGQLAFEHALSTIHYAVPSAPTIHIFLPNKCQQAAIQFRLDDPAPLFVSNAPSSHDDDDDHRVSSPNLQVILDETGKDIGPVAGLLAAHSLHPDSKWLVLGCGYPLLPASALLQLILEYRDPVTCFVDENGIVEPLIGIWSPEALEKLRESVEMGGSGLGELVGEVEGKLVRPLREEWIRGVRTMEEWEEVSKILRSGDDYGA